MNDMNKLKIGSLIKHVYDRIIGENNYITDEDDVLEIIIYEIKFFGDICYNILENSDYSYSYDIYGYLCRLDDISIEQLKIHIECGGSKDINTRMGDLRDISSDEVLSYYNAHRLGG